MEHEKNGFSTERHFARIDNVLVKTALVDSLSQLQRSGEPIHDNVHNWAQDPYISRIIGLYAESYSTDETLTHPEIWQKAKAEAVRRALDYSSRLEGKSISQSSGEDADDANNKLDEKTKRAHEKYALERAKKRNELALEHYYKTAVAMSAIDQFSGVVGPDDDDPSDELLMSASGPITKARHTADREWRCSGTVMTTPGASAICLSTLTHNRREQITFNRASRAIADFKAGANANTLAWTLASYNFSKALNHGASLDLGKYNKLVASIADGEFSVDHTLDFLVSIPCDAMSTIYTHGDDKAKSFIIGVLSRYSAANKHKKYWPFIKYTKLLDSCLPGGLMSNTTRNEPLAQELRADFKGDDVEMLIDALKRNFDGNPHELWQTAEHNTKSRDTMRAIFEALFAGDPRAAQFSERHIRSITPRAYSDDEQPNYDNFRVAAGIKTITKHVANIGAKAFLDLHERFDLGAADIMTEDDIIVLHGLLVKDPDILQRLRSTDVSLVFFDAYGDEVSAMQIILQQLDTPAPDTTRIVMPFVQTADFEQTWAMLGDEQIKPCSLIFNMHGSPSQMHCNKGDEYFIIAGEDLPRPMSWKSDHVKTPKLFLNNSTIASAVATAMQQPRFETVRAQTPNKRIVFASCSSDKSLRTFRKNANHWKSIAEATASAINQPDVSIVASEDIATVNPRDAGQGLFMFGYKRGQYVETPPGKTPYKSNMVELTAKDRDGWVRINRRRIEERLAS